VQVRARCRGDQSRFERPRQGFIDAAFARVRVRCDFLVPRRLGGPIVGNARDAQARQRERTVLGGRGAERAIDPERDGDAGSAAAQMGSQLSRAGSLVGPGRELDGGFGQPNGQALAQLGRTGVVGPAGRDPLAGRAGRFGRYEENQQPLSPLPAFRLERDFGQGGTGGGQELRLLTGQVRLRFAAQGGEQVCVQAVEIAHQLPVVGPHLEASPCNPLGSLEAPLVAQQARVHEVLSSVDLLGSRTRRGGLRRRHRDTGSARRCPEGNAQRGRGRERAIERGCRTKGALSHRRTQ